MSDDRTKATAATDPVGQAAARLEAAVERLADAFAVLLADRRSSGDAARDGLGGAALEDMVPRAEVAALADRLDATVARLRGALAEELRRPEEE
jgi:hypothetical protein